jgi:hypothetical protein
MMQINKIIALLGILLLVGLASCVKKYEPSFELSNSHKIVVSGNLTDLEGYHTVSVSVTSPIDRPENIPLINCKVNLCDESGNTWKYQESSPGRYELWLSDKEIDLSKSYYISIITPENQEIVSTIEGFENCPDVDSLSFERAEYPNELTGKISEGLQFFIDLKASDTDSRYYYYEVTETSEFHSPRPIEWWYDGIVHHEVPADYSKTLCWNTQIINDIFVLSTDNLSTNEYKMFKLNFTNNQSQRLAHLYSLNIRQFSISREAFIYWNQMRINKHQSGGLYNNQPLAVKGNMKNRTNPDQEVLGYFMVNKVKERRFFIPPQGLNIIDNTCGKPAKLRFGLRDIDPIQYPAYLDGDQNRYFNSLLDKGCVDCTSDGGTTTKPSFWP